MLTDFSNQLADIIDTAALSVLQVHGRRRPASGVACSEDVVITTMRALGREDGLRVRRHDGETLDARLAGWDPTTTLRGHRGSADAARRAGLAKQARRVRRGGLQPARLSYKLISARQTPSLQSVPEFHHRKL